MRTENDLSDSQALRSYDLDITQGRDDIVGEGSQYGTSADQSI